MGWRDGVSAAGFGGDTELFPPVPGDAAVESKDAENCQECKARPGNNPRAKEKALHWETSGASPLYLLKKKNESDLITAHKRLLREKTPGTAKPP